MKNQHRNSKPQNYSNHRRYIPFFHFITLGLATAALFLSVFKLYKAVANEKFYYVAAVLVIISLVLLLLFWYCRLFALKAQDRAIRAEENFRHYLLTGKPLDNTLQIKQIVALRFASDDEFPALAKKAANESLTPTEIKKTVKSWKADFERV